MYLEDVHSYCLAKRGVEETFPFDEKTLVFKVGGKMFALCNVDEFQSINLKCDPERAIDLRERYTGVKPGWHMSKIHWNTVEVNQDVPDSLIFELIDHSYDLVFKSLTKKIQHELTS